MVQKEISGPFFFSALPLSRRTGRKTPSPPNVSRTATTGRDISALALYTAANALVLSGTQISTGAVDIWQLSADVLPVSYYLQVVGTVVSDGAASYGAAALLTAVPEPATLGMLAGGLGLIGLAARRRTRPAGGKLRCAAS